jgi:flagellin
MLSLNVNPQFAINLSQRSAETDSAMLHLSTGKRINTSADDPAGMTIAETMRSTINGAQQAQRNTQDAINIVKIGEDGVNGLMPILDRMKELVVRAGNSTMTQGDKDAIQGELDQMRGLFAQSYQTAKDFRIALDGKTNADRVLWFQTGPNANDLVSVDYNPLRNILGPLVISMFGYKDLYNSPYQEILAGYGPTPIPKPDDPVPPPPIGPNVPPGTTWDQAFPKKLVVNSGQQADIDASNTLVTDNKAAIVGQVTYLGAVENRLQANLEQVSSFEINISDSESKIRDVDIASEMTKLTKSQVVQQSAQAMLAQANQRSSQVLALLRPNG